MRKPSEKEHDDTSISRIHERFEKLVNTPRSIFEKVKMTIQEVQEKFNVLLKDEANKTKSNDRLKEKVKKLKPFPLKK